MSYAGILLDIDNTLYNYEYCHNLAISKVFEYAKLEMKASGFQDAYTKARKHIHLELAETAASHNRLLYFQRACEYLKLSPLVWAFKLYNLYWDTFLDSIILYDGVIEFLTLAREKYTVLFLTDLTAHIQYRKIEKLGLDKYVTHILTSEEAGHEKPHPYMFLSALNKLGLQASEVCMIGDNYKRDIIGASSLGIRSIWLNATEQIEVYPNRLIREIKEFKDLLGLL